MTDAPDPVVRTGTPSDMEGVMALTMACHTENGFVNANMPQIVNDVWASLTQQGGIAGVIGGNGSPLEGCVVIRIGTAPYSTKEVLEEKFLFVHPDFRAAKIGRARRLAEFTKTVSDSLALPLLIGVLSNQRTKAKVRMYERIFGEPAGAFFLYNARTGVFQTEGEA